MVHIIVYHFCDDDDDCSKLSCPLEGGISAGWGGRGSRLRKGRPNRNSDVTRGRSHRFFSVKGVGREGARENMNQWGSSPQDGRAEGVRE